MRIVVLGGGFGGVATARHLERRLGGRSNVELTLVSRENFFVLTPLLFEACSGRLELRHCAQPIRPALRRTRFVEASVDQVDVERRIVRATAPDGGRYELPYDQLGVVLGPHVQDHGRRAPPPKPRDRAVRARRRGGGSGPTMPGSHLCRGRRRSGGDGAAGRAHGLRRRCAALLPPTSPGATALPPL